MILVTGFEPFGAHKTNPSEEIARALDGRSVAAHEVRGEVLPVHHRDAAARVAALVAEREPAAIVHLGLAEGRTRIALERVALNVMDYRLPDNAGYRAEDEPCAPDGPPAYFATLPLRDILPALAAAGVPAYVSSTAGTFLCNQTLYTTLHAVTRAGRPTRVGFVHLPLSAGMVAGTDLDAPSMDLPLMLRAVATVIAVTASALPTARS